MPDRPDIVAAYEEATSRLASRVLAILQTADRRELAALIGVDKAATLTREHRIKQVAQVKAPLRKTREWPRCSVEGCGRNVYMPSGQRKVCYQHHIEAGGEPSPLVKKHKARYAAPPAPEPAEERKPRTVLRKAGKTLTGAPAPDPAVPHDGD